MAKYSRYQDYVIKEGRFVGEFEEMYRDHGDPWEQTTREKDAIEKLIAVEIIRRKGYQRVIELGCGLGDFTAKLDQVAESVLGIDISQTAIDKARQRYPDLNFQVADLLDFDVYRRYQPDCIVMAEISWYVLDKLARFKSFIHSELSARQAKKEVGFVHLLMTYREGEQQYGREYFTNLNEILRYWDCIKFEEWGGVNREEYQGGSRTFCHGTIF